MGVCGCNGTRTLQLNCRRTTTSGKDIPLKNLTHVTSMLPLPGRGNMPQAPCHRAFSGMVLPRCIIFAKNSLTPFFFYKENGLAFAYPSFFRASCRIRTNDPEITNHVLWPTELKRRVGSLLYRAATTKYPCYVPILGDSEGAGRAGLPVFAAAKVIIFFEKPQMFLKKFCISRDYS